jgi:NDP-sugar pyrophosphorylase family protein
VPDARRNVIPVKRISPPVNNLTVVITTFGLEHRNKNTYSKSLIPLKNGYTLLEQQILIIKDILPQADIIVVVDGQSDKLLSQYKKYKIRIVYNTLFETSNIGYGIYLALQASTKDNALIIQGNILFDGCVKNLVQFHSTSLVSNKIKQSSVGVLLQDKYITNFSYSFHKKWSGIVYLTGEEFRYYQKFVSEPNNMCLFNYEILNQILDRGGKIISMEYPEMYLKEINSIGDAK